jgi:hypothetical protein
MFAVKMRGDCSFYGRDRVVVGFITTYAISVYPVEFNKSSTHVVSDMKIFKYQPLVIRKHLLIGLVGNAGPGLGQAQQCGRVKSRYTKITFSETTVSKPDFSGFIKMLNRRIFFLE